MHIHRSLLALAFVATACDDDHTHVAATVPVAAAVTPALYACPMHADVTAASTGTCPQCGMALVARAHTPAPAAAPAPDAVAHDDHAGTAEAHGDHEARHGGLVLMSGDHHFEVVLDPQGTHRVYMSDEGRTPLPAEKFAGSLTVMQDDTVLERLPLTPAGDHLQAKGKPAAGATMARLELVLGGAAPYSIDVPFTSSEKGKPKHAHRHDHKH